MSTQERVKISAYFLFQQFSISHFISLSGPFPKGAKEKCSLMLVISLWEIPNDSSSCLFLFSPEETKNARVLERGLLSAFFSGSLEKEKTQRPCEVGFFVVVVFMFLHSGTANLILHV